MTSRRNFLLGIPAATLLSSPGIAGALAPPASRTVGSHVDADMLKALMLDHLEGELGDRSVAAKLLTQLFDAGLQWSPPLMPAASADTIIAYSFGNRLLPGKVPADAERLDDEMVYAPGPINMLLADAVHAIRGGRAIAVYAQWEIAGILRDKYAMQDVIAIRSERDAQGRKVYLSTDGVAKAIIDRAGSVEKLGRTAIVGHRDHVKRCVIVSRDHGIEAAVAEEVQLPVHYDPLSGQAWTRERHVYLLNDVLAQLSIARGRILRATE